MKINLALTLQVCRPTLAELLGVAQYWGWGWVEICEMLDQLIASGKIGLDSNLRYHWVP